METAMERIDRELGEHFGSEVGRLESAAETFEAARKRLFRDDGSPRYSEAEHAERLGALLTTLDTSLADVTKSAEAAIARGQAELVKLEGRDPLDRLSPTGQAQAAARREFVREDAERLPLARIVEVVNAAMVSGDLPILVLWHRYLGSRLETERASSQQPANPGSARALAADIYRALETRVVGDPAEIRTKRQAMERRISSAQVLAGRVRRARSVADGTEAARLAAMRRSYGGTL